MPSLAEFLTRLDGKAVLTAQDTLDVRRLFYADGVTVTPAEAEALVRLNLDAGEVSPEWSALYVEALTDFMVRQQSPVGYVDQAKADWLVAAVSRDGVRRADEVEALVHVLETAEEVPASLSAFVLQTVKTAMLARAGQGPGDQGFIGPDDVARLRRVLFAGGGEANIGVTRHEAEALFDINDAFRDAPNDAAWTDLFMRAVANSVLYVATWHEPSAQQELKREAWLADTAILDQLDFGKLLRDPAGAFKTAGEPSPELVAHWARRWHNPLSLGEPVTFTSEEQVRYDADAALESEAQKVTAEEAHWLLDHIGRDGRFDAREQALVGFLVANATSIDPSLQPLIARLKATPVPATAPADGKP
ncbi:MAG: hypothetical protein WA840_00125, partial [Caulobacteraceae bacterium]